MGKQRLENTNVKDKFISASLENPMKIAKDKELAKDSFINSGGIDQLSSKSYFGNIQEFDENIIPIGGFQSLSRERALKQSTGEQILNAAGQLVPAIGLGIIENAGYLLELPNALGASDKKDYSNSLVEWSKEKRGELEEALPIYRENPEEVFDMSDGAWWVQHGLGLSESIGEFLVTGAGVGSGLSKSAQLAAKITGSQVVAKGSAALAQGLTASSLAYTEGAISGSEIYKEVYDNLLEETGDPALANQRASEAASKTVKMNTGINTFLNLSGIAPLFTKNSNSLLKAGLTKRSGESTTNYLKRLNTELENIKLVNPKLSDNILREAIQEGVEEQVNLVAEIEGRLEGGLVSEDQVGGSLIERIKNAITSEEGLLNFGLGAFGGAGQNFGVNVISRGNRSQAEIEKYVNKKQQIQNTIDLIQRIDGQKREMNTLISEGKVNEAELIKNNIFNIIASEYVKNGTSDALVNTFQEISSVDNTKDLGADLEQQLNKELSGVTEAMQQGLAENKDDNNYKKVASDKIAEIKNLNNKYQQFQLQYNTTLEEKQSNIAEEIFNRYASKVRMDNNFTFSSSRRNDFQLSLSDRNIQPEKINSYSNKSKRTALNDLKKYYQNVDKSKLSKEEKLKRFNTTNKSEIKRIATDRINRINEELSLIPTVQNQGELDSSILSNNIELEIDYNENEFLKNEANEKYSSLVYNKDERNEIINKRKREIDNVKKSIQDEEGKKVNDKRKKLKDIQDKVSKIPETEENKARLDQVKSKLRTTSDSNSNRDIDNVITDTNRDLVDLFNQVDVDENIPTSSENKKLDIKETPKVIDAATAFGNRSINEDETLNENYPLVLMTGQIKEGDKVTLEIDKEFKREELDQTDYEIYKNNPDKIPIVIKRGNERVGYLHRPDWITEDNVVESTSLISNNIEYQKKLLKELRDRVISGEISEVTIESIGGESVLAKSSTIVPISNSIPELEIGIVTDEGIEVDGNIIETANSTDFLEKFSGRVVTIVPKINSKIPIAAPTSLSTVSETHANLIYDVVDVYLTKNDNKKSNAIKNKLGLDVKNRKDLESFLSNYIFISKQSPAVIAQKNGDRVYFMLGDQTETTTDRIILQSDGGQPLTINKEDLQSNKDTVLEHIQNMFYSINNENITKDFINEIYENGEIDNISYKNHIKSIANTNLKPIEFKYKGKDYKSYFVNPMFYLKLPFNTDEIFNEFAVSPKPKIKQEKKDYKNPNQSKKEQDDIKESLNKLVDLGIGQYKANTDKNVDLLPFTADSDKYQILYNSLKNEFRTDPNITEDITNTLAVDLIKRSYVPNSNPFEDLKLFLVENEVFSNPDQYLNLAFNKLKTIGIIKSSQEIDQETFEDIDFTFERVKFNDDYNFSIDNKFNASSTIKKLFYTVPELNQDGTYKLGAAGNKYLPIDSVFNTLKTILADVDSSYEKMISKLEEKTSNLPWLEYIVDVLENPEGEGIGNIDIQKIRNEFVTLMSNHHYDFKTIIYNKNGENRVISSDQQSKQRLIVNSWNENIKSSDLVKETQDGYEINDLEAKEILDQYQEFKRNKKENKIEVNSKESINFLKDILPKIGIQLSDSTIINIVNEKIDGKYLPSSIYNNNGLIGNIFEEFDKRVKKDITFEQSNPLFNNTRVLKLAELETENSNNYQSSSFLNPEGNNVSAININREFTRRTRELTNTDKAKQLVKIPFNKNNGETWLAKFAKKDDQFLRNFSFEVLSGLVNKEYYESGTTSNSLSPREQEISKIISFLNNNNDINSRFLHFIPSKNTTVMIQAPKLKGVKLINNLVNDLTIDNLYSIVQSEVERINNVDIYGNAGKKFYIFDSLNKEIQGLDNNSLQLIINNEVNITPNIEQAIKNHLKNQINLMINDKISIWNDLGIIRDDKFLFENESENVREFAADYVVNQIWFNYNMMQSYIGDPAQFAKSSVTATWNNFFKRLAKDSAPYLNVPEDSDNKFYLQVALKDRITESKYIDSIPTEYQEFYKTIETTDAQEFTTWQEHLFLLKQYGKIGTENYNNIVSKLEQELNLNDRDLETVFQPIKPVATGKRLIYSGRNPIAELSDYVKSSSIPLIPQFTEGLEIDKLRIKLESLESQEDRFVRASFSTANKLGGGKELDIWNEDGSIKDFEIAKDNYVELDRSSMGVQQEVPFKPENEVVDGSQQRKLILSALNLGFFSKKKRDEILNEYNETYRKIYNDAWNELEQSITNDEGNIDNVKLHNLLVNEAESRNWSKHDIDYFELDDNNKFKIPLYYNNLSSKVEPLLSSIINNKVLKLKRNGNSYVLRTQEGFQGFNKRSIYTSNYDGELKPARWEKDGKIVSSDTEDAIFKPAQVLVPRSLFKNLKFTKISLEEQNKLTMSLIKDENLSNNFKNDIKINFIENKNLNVNVEIFKIFDIESEEKVSARKIQNMIKEKYKEYKKLMNCLRKI